MIKYNIIALMVAPNPHFYKWKIKAAKSLNKFN